MNNACNEARANDEATKRSVCGEFDAQSCFLISAIPPDGKVGGSMHKMHESVTSDTS